MVIPDIDYKAFCDQLLAIRTKYDFQHTAMLPFLELLANKTTEGITDSGIENVDQTKAYTMITNHRDIVLDASFLNLSLLKRNARTTEVAIGNNLLIYPWIEKLVRLNKSVIVKRDVGMRHALEAGNTTIWIHSFYNNTKKRIPLDCPTPRKSKRQ